MAATMIGGAFLSATVQTLVEKLASTEFLDYIKNTKLNVSLLRQLKTTLLTLQVVLDDAEEKQINNPAVKQWLDDLKDAIFDAEDLINEISYDSLRCKVKNTHAQNKTNQVLNFLSSPFNSFYREINSQMKIMCESLQLFAQHKDVLGLQTKSARVSYRSPSSSVVNESVMVGRKDDKETIMNMLLSQRDTSDNNTGVVAILGMGGLGKTTLAQLVYNDKEVQQHFDLKAWACVSQDFDIRRVTKSLLESVTSRTSDSNNLDVLQVELKKISREKRFLFVLDDLWNDNYNDWSELVSPFIDGKPGSMVIITTRQRKVAEVAHTFPIHELKLLSNEDCWSLLSKHALGSDEFHHSTNMTLEEIGRKIARKCQGLPIAAKTIGGLLRSKVDITEWTSILNSNVWNLSNDNILPALHLSYQYLPSHLKRCFAYCSIFPKDCPLDRKKLVLLWMAEGFLDCSHGGKTMEELGDDCFVELLSRSLIQQSNDDARGESYIKVTLCERTQLSLLESDSLCRMQNVVIEKCVMLSSVPKLILRSTCLTHLTLNSLSSLTAFPSSGLPTSLQSLEIENCENLSFLPPETWSNYTRLVSLIISNSCDALTSFPLDGFPALQTLSILNCRSLDCIYILERSSPRSSSLQSLQIISHNSIELFEVKLKMDMLTALEWLGMECKKLSFCEGVCLPPKLQEIGIHTQKTTPLVTEWGLQDLTALSRLNIGKGDDDIFNTLMKESLLPISLVSLDIGELYEMKSFDGNGLRHLSSLQSLCFWGCEQLDTLPEKCLPSSLKSLQLWQCEKLESLPEDSLPDSLEELEIRDCPLLEERYKRKEHWSKIAHIPVIHINDEVTI